MKEEAKVLLSALAKINDPCDVPDCALWIRHSTNSTSVKIPVDDVSCQTTLKGLIQALLQQQLNEADEIRGQLTALTEDPTVRG